MEESTVNTTKTRAEIKAERRAKQELQRANKQAKKGAKENNINLNKDIQNKITNNEIIENKNLGAPHEDELTSPISFEVERLSVMWTGGNFIDSTCLTLAMIDSLNKLLSDYDSMEEMLTVVDKFITCCSSRIVLPTSGDSFMDYLKSCIPLSTNKEFLLEALEGFRRKRLVNAVEFVDLLTKRVLRLRGAKSVAVFSYTMSVVAALTDWEDPLDDLVIYLIECSQNKGKAKVVMEKLKKQGINAYYANLGGIATILPDVDLVLIGAETVYADGAIMAGCGSSVILLMAQYYKISAYVLYETVKLSVQVFSPTIVGSGGCEVVSRRFPMTFISETDIHSTILGLSRRSVNIHT